MADYRARSELLDSKVAVPQPDDGWTDYTPVVTAGTGAFTATVPTGRYKRLGSLVFVTVSITITTTGTAATSMLVTLPITANNAAIQTYGSGRQSLGHAITVWGASTTQMGLQKYDGTFTAVNGEIWTATYLYEPVV